MKSLTVKLILTLFLFGLVQALEAQVKNKDLRAIRLAKKEAKNRKKEGWDVPPGSLPMEKQFERAWGMELETDEYGNPKYLVATGAAVAGTRTAADQAAMTAARNELAAAIQTKVSQLIQTKTANDQIDQEVANTLDKTVANGKALIQSSLRQVTTAYKIYRDVNDPQNKRKNVGVEVKLFYDQDEAMRAAQKAIRKELEKESDKLGKELDKVLEEMGWPE